MADHTTTIKLVVLLIATAVANGDTYHVKRIAPQSLGNIRADALYAHNIVRRRHIGTRDLTWSAKLTGDAQRYALRIASSGAFKHDSFIKDGENLYAGSGKYVKPFSVAAYSWYEERNRFNYNTIYKYNFYGIGKLGHFTQMVWSQSLKVGCAGATVTNGNVMTYYVCRYSPPGNILGKFDNFVKPIKNNFQTPNSPWFFKRPLSSSSGCNDATPSYCATINTSLCQSPIFGAINCLSCKRTCNLC